MEETKEVTGMTDSADQARQAPAGAPARPAAIGLTLEDIHQTRFPSTRSHGYLIQEVDELLDRVEQGFDPTDPAKQADLLRLVAGARFHMSAEIGYDPTPVDAFLDRLQHTLAATAGGAA